MLEKPATLKMEPIRVENPGLSRWLGSPRHRGTRFEYMKWLPDGSRVFIKSTMGFTTQVWEPSASGAELTHIGNIEISPHWVVSPGGKWLISQEYKSGGGLCLYQLDTLEGKWKVGLNACRYLDFLEEDQTLIVVARLGDIERVYKMESATGRVLASYDLPKTVEFMQYDHVISANRSQVVFGPKFDPERRITLLRTESWKPIPVSEPLENAAADNVTLSQDGQWLAVWDDYEYHVRRWDGTHYAVHFQGETDFDQPGCRLTSVKISPDSTHIVVAGGGKYKVIRLSDKKVTHESSTDCLCGDFSPDGTKFWRTCDPYRAVNTRDWEPLGPLSPGQRDDIDTLEFSPDGTRLGAGSGNSVNIWNLGSGALEYVLKSPGNKTLRMFGWMPDAKEIIGGDVTQHLRWRLTPAPGGQTTSLVGEPFAPREEPVTQAPGVRKTWVDPVTGWCLLSSKQSWESTDLRHPSKPAVVRRLKLVVGDEAPVRDAAFSGKSREIFYHRDGKIFAYDLDKDTLRRSELSIGGEMSYARGAHIIGISDFKKITLFDPATLAPVAEHLPPPGGSWKPETALSPDGKWLFGQYTPPRETPRLCLFDIETKKPAFVSLPMQPPMNCCAFSPDSQTLAIAHVNGSISMWSVPDMVKAGVPDEFAKDYSRPAPQTSFAYRGKSTQDPKGIPETPLKLPNGDEWQMTSTGVLSNKSGQSSVGQLLVNDRQLAIRMTRGTFVNFEKSQMITGYVEMVGGSPGITVRRTVRMTSTGEALWKDLVENRTDSEKNITLSFVTGLGATPQQMRTPADITPTVQNDRIGATGVMDALGTITSHGGVHRMMFIGLCTASAPIPPVMKWDPNTQCMLSTWNLRLAPYQRMAFAHIHYQKPAVQNERIGSTMHLWQASQAFGSQFNAELVTFANARPETDALATWRRLLSHDKQYNEQGFLVDALGFRWIKHDSIFDGMGSEMGGEQIFRLWIGGAPMGMADGMKTEDIKQVPVRFSMDALDQSGRVHVKRRLGWSKETSSCYVHDTITNQGGMATSTAVEVMVVANDKVLGLLGPDGAALNATLTVPVDLASVDRKVAVVFKGNSKPAILLGLGGPGGANTGKVYLNADRAVIVRHDVLLQPGESKSLVYFAVPRPLEAYPSVKEAFLEIKSGDFLEKFTGYGYPAPANWTTPEKPAAQ